MLARETQFTKRKPEDFCQQTMNRDVFEKTYDELDFEFL